MFKMKGSAFWQAVREEVTIKRSVVFAFGASVSLLAGLGFAGGLMYGAKVATGTAVISSFSDPLVRLAAGGLMGGAAFTCMHPLNAFGRDIVLTAMEPIFKRRNAILKQQINKVAL
jgi:hypothetical protein